jgi:hypothetical protein
VHELSIKSGVTSLRLRNIISRTAALAVDPYHTLGRYRAETHAPYQSACGLVSPAAPKATAASVASTLPTLVAGGVRLEQRGGLSSFATYPDAFAL